MTLPAYQAGKDNYYAISAIAYDNKGNASKRVQTEVVISGAGMSADRTALTLDGQSRAFKCLLTVMSKSRWCCLCATPRGSQSRA
ncbi:hypothetical protein DMI69_10480 [Escherichia coli]|nr:hypothetical protein [Escherichia coli]